MQGQSGQKRRIMAQVVGIVAIFIARCDLIDPLPDQCLLFIGDPVWIARIEESTRDQPGDTDLIVKLPQGGNPSVAAQLLLARNHRHSPRRYADFICVQLELLATVCHRDIPR